jgi:uncharacterized membrane protein (DUF106 family)
VLGYWGGFKMNDYKELNRELKTLQTKVEKDIRMANQYTSEIMELIDNQDEMTRSDLQGAVIAIVIKILQEGKNGFSRC